MLSTLPMRGLFRGFDCDTLAGHPLGKVNILFGRNGTGKTSLSESLRLAFIKHSDAPRICQPFTANETVAVFNRFYVDETLSPFIDGASSAPALAIGNLNVSLKATEARLLDHIQSREATEARLTARLEDIETLKEVAAKAKRAIVAKLGEVHPRYSNISFRNTETFRNRIENLEFTPSQVPESQLLADAQMTEIALDPPKLLEIEDCPGSLFEIADRIAAFNLRYSETPVQIPHYKAEWLRQGLATLQGHDEDCTAGKCPFCDQALSAEFVEELQKALGAPLVRLEDELGAIREEVKKYLQHLKGVLSSTEVLRIPHQGHNAPLEGPRRELCSRLESWVDWVDFVVGCIDTRSLNTSDSKFKLHAPPPIPDPSEVNAILAAYRKGASNAAQTRAYALLELENRIILPFHSDNLTKAQNRMKISRALNAVRGSLSRARLELAATRDSMMDTTAAARRMTRDLHSGLGIQGFSIEPNADRTAYRIVRPGKVSATYLSEGERHIVALLYFLYSLESIEYASKELIVYIDDPGTSLDTENIHAILEFVRSSSRGWEQLILSTHSVYTFKQAQRIWDTAEDLNLSGEASLSQAPHEPESTHVDPTITRFFETSFSEKGRHEAPLWGISQVSPALVRFSSDYEYSYWMTISAAAGDVPTELLPGLANTSRRALEGLLSFKCPGVGNVRNALDEVWSKVDTQGNFSALKVSSMAFMNRSSHKSDSPGGSHLWAGVGQRDFILSTAVLAIIDPEHFARLLRSFTWLTDRERQRYERIPAPYISLLKQAQSRPEFDADAVVRAKIAQEA